MPPPKQGSSKTVAIVGAGPAALSAAYYLRKVGHTVFGNIVGNIITAVMCGGMTGLATTLILYKKHNLRGK